MEIKLFLTRKCIYNLILGTACILLLIFFSVRPYFYYGNEEIILMPEEGILGLLDGKWVTEKPNGTDGYYSVTIAGKKNIRIEWQKDGVKSLSSASYKYSRASKELSFNLLDENGNTVNQIPCTFDPLLILGGRKEVSLVQYLVKPFEYEEMDQDISVNREDYFINQAVIFPLIIMIALIVTALIGFICHDKSIAPFLAVGDSVLAVIVYLINPLLCFGQDRLFHILCFIALLLLSGYIICRTVFRKDTGR